MSWTVFCLVRKAVFVFCCVVRSPVFSALSGKLYFFFAVLSGTMRCPGVCTGLQRQNSRLGPENADKSGKKAAKNEVFGHRELKLFRGTRKSAIFGSHRAKILL